MCIRDRAYNEPNTAIGDGTGTWVYNAQAAVLATPPANIPNSILNPMTYLQSPYNGHADWYCTGTDPKATHPGLWGPEKTIFDPCPPGYKVPGPDLWGIPAGNNSITNGGAAADYDETGGTPTKTAGAAGKTPATTTRWPATSTTRTTSR